MSFVHETVAASYRFCRRFGSRSGSNFWQGFRLLSGDRRRAMEALYAFTRASDDLADSPTLGMEAGAAPISEYQRQEVLDYWRHALQQALSAPSDSTGVPCPLVPPDFPVYLGRLSLGILPALADTVHRFQIPHEYLFSFLDGVEMDLRRRRYETFEQLERYCERVASAVGLACIHIWGFQGSEALEPARKAGVALQLTNILRDLAEDAKRGRVYLPLAEIQEAEYYVADLFYGVTDGRFLRLMARQIARAESYYACGAKLLDFLQPQGKRIFGLLLNTYHALLRKIARRPEAVFQGRVTLSRLMKTWLFFRWRVLPVRRKGRT